MNNNLTATHPRTAGGSATLPDLPLLARLCAGSARADEVPDSQWPHLLELALHHGVAPLLYLRARKDAISPAALESLSHYYRRNVARNLALAREQQATGQLLQQAGVAVLALKGPELSGLLYGDVGARQVTDLDFLLPPPQLPQADALLASRGYHRVTHDSLAALQFCRDVLYEKPLPAGGRVMLDLHLRLRPYGRRDALAARIQCEGLTPENLLLLLCLNVITHRFARLLPWLDLATALQQTHNVQWLRFQNAAEQMEWPGGVFYCLRFAAELGGQRAPDAVLRALSPPWLDRRWMQFWLGGDLRAILQRAAALDGPRGTLATLGCEKGILPKLSLASAILFPAPAALRQMDPRPSVAPLPLHYAQRAARKLRQITRRAA